MATDKQIKANRINAKKSTGPRTAAGKGKSSRNAVTHGLTAVVHVDDSEREAVDKRTKAWSDELVVNGSEVQRDLVALAVLSYHIVGKALKCEAAGTAHRSAAAEQLWRIEQSKELSTNVEMLDERPLVAVAGLSASWAGVDWMVQSWNGILHAFNNNAWTIDCHRRARRLMGLAEKDDVMGRCLPDVWNETIERYVRHEAQMNEPFCTLPWEERVLRMENIEKAMAIDEVKHLALQVEVQAMANEYEEVINQQILRLSAAREIHKANEPQHIDAARNRALIDVSPEGKLRMRYKVEAEKSMFKYLDVVAKLTAQMAKQDRNESRADSRNEADRGASNGSTDQHPAGTEKPVEPVAPKKRGRDRRKTA